MHMMQVMQPVVVLAGGVGAARFLRGLVQVVPPAEIVVIGNTADDIWWHGLYVAPDLDTVSYWLAGIADFERGWGIAGDTFIMQARLGRLTDESWFRLGDRDLATHLYRTGRLRAGVPLDVVTDELRRRLEVASRILPMSNAAITTRLKTDRPRRLSAGCVRDLLDWLGRRHAGTGHNRRDRGGACRHHRSQ